MAYKQSGRMDRINEQVREVLPELLKEFSIVHLCGKGNLSEELEGTKGYFQSEYIKKELPDLFAMADLVISRAGANAICEISSLAKPNLLIPLSANASRGDQILNAGSFEKQGFSMVLQEEDLNAESLLAAVHQLYADKGRYIEAMETSGHTDSTRLILDVIREVLGISSEE